MKLILRAEVSAIVVIRKLGIPKDFAGDLFSFLSRQSKHSGVKEDLDPNDILPSNSVHSIQKTVRGVMDIAAGLLRRWSKAETSDSDKILLEEFILIIIHWMTKVTFPAS